MSSKSHPVWDVYDQFRTARLSCKYYSARLAGLERTNFWMEALIAATASGSALAALTFWQTADGKVVWTVLTAVSAVLAVIKPLLKLTERITKFEELATGYSLLDHGYGKLVVAISQRRTFDRDLQLQFQALLDQADDLKAKEVIERRLDQTLREVCEHAVGAELPPAKFFVPEII